MYKRNDYHSFAKKQQLTLFTSQQWHKNNIKRNIDLNYFKSIVYWANECQSD